MISELLEETEAFVEQVQQQFEDASTWDMAKLEEGLREALLKDGCRILEGLLDQPRAMGKHVPLGKLHENRSKRVQSLLGPFELSRGYDQTEKGRMFPMDRLLGLSESYTPGLAKVMCRAAATDGSYDEAEETLRVYAGVNVPASQIRKIVQQISPQLGEWAKDREETRNEAVSTMYVAYDGTGVPMRKDQTKGRKGKKPDGSSGTREVKLGSVFTSQEFDEDGYPVRDPDSTTYVASFETAELFGARIRQEARLRGLSRALRIAILGDGAHWIWNLARINFPWAKQILDFFHACEHLSVLASALFPGQEEKVSEQVEKWKKWLENDNVLKMVAEAAKALPQHGPRRKIADREMEYFRSNAERMMYASFRKEGFFIGSGVVEAGCKTVVGKRTKQSGMFWNVDGAQNVLNIRCSILSDTYDQYWKYRRRLQMKNLNLAA